MSDFEEHEMWRAAVLETPASAELLEPGAAARAARRARRAMHEYGIPLSALDAYPTEEVRALKDWIERFENRCRALQATSAAQLLTDIEAPHEPIAWLESPAWRPVARRWLQRQAAPLMVPQATAPCGAWLARAASADDEVAAAAEWARGHLAADGGFCAWICVPDLSSRRAEVADAFDSALAPRRFSLSPADGPAPYAVAGGTPLDAYAPVRSALQFLEIVAGPVPFERFSAILRSPQLQATDADASRSAALDIHLRARGPSEASLADWLSLCERIGAGRSRLEEPGTALARLRAAREALGSAHAAMPLSRWITLWAAAFERAPWADNHRWSSGEYQAAERMRELMGTLGAGDAVFGSQSLQGARRLLASAARDTPFQPQTGVPAVWISGQRMDPWLNYSGIWVTGVSEELWPPPAEPIALLPVRLQVQHGVIAAGAESQWVAARDLQIRWRARAAELVFSLAIPADGTLAVPSALLPLDLAPLPADPLPHPAANGGPRPLWRRLLAAAPRLERLDDEHAPRFLAGLERTRGVSTLRAQSRCAFRGFAETRLACERMQKPTPGFNELERGTLVHRALEHVWESLQDSSALLTLSAGEEDRLLTAAIERALTEACRRRDPGAAWRSREALRLRRVLGEWLTAERLREPFAVERLERGGECVRHAGVDFSVRIDRIDRLADGARVLIDYKTGSVAADWRGERPDNPQLPVYAIAHRSGLVAAAYGRVSVGDCCFVAESERTGIFKPGGRASLLEGRGSIQGLFDDWTRRIERLAGEFAAGAAQVAPTAVACRTCHLQGLCRVSVFDEPAPAQSPAQAR